MSLNFWQKLQKSRQPILALAPMAGFTDSAFRQVCQSFKADVLYSEMISATALHYGFLGKTKNRLRDSGAQATWEIAYFNPRVEKNYVVQLFGANPEHFGSAASLIDKKLKPNGIDLNFGCPAGKVIKQGAGADLMKDLKRSRAVIKAVLENTTLPVSVKIRIKAGEVGAIDFLKNIADLPVSALMIHGRSLSQGFSGKVDFSLFKKARQYFKGIILANGGINNLSDAQNALKSSGADGIGLARGILGRPWLFQEIKENRIINKSKSEIFQLVLEHAKLVEKIKGPKAFLELRKHLVWYVNGFSGASQLRSKLVTVNTYLDLKKIFNRELENL